MPDRPVQYLVSESKAHRCPSRGHRWISLVDDQTTRSARNRHPSTKKDTYATTSGAKPMKPPRERVTSGASQTSRPRLAQACTMAEKLATSPEQPLRSISSKHCSACRTSPAGRGKQRFSCRSSFGRVWAVRCLMRKAELVGQMETPTQPWDGWSRQTCLSFSGLH